MALKKFYHDIGLENVGQLVGARAQNITTADRTTLGGTLGAGNTGLHVYDTDLSMPLYWDGAAWQPIAIEIEGDVIFRGVLLAADYGTDPAFTAPGSLYKAAESGTLTFPGVSTYVPSAVVEPGDEIMFTAADTVYIVQRNDEQATETTLGNVRLASQAQVDTGADAETAVTPATLQGKIDGLQLSRSFSATVNLVANTPLNVNHALALDNLDGFTVNVMHGGAQIGVDVVSVDADNITLESNVALTGVRVTVIGY